MFLVAVFIVAILSGATATVVGFGIGSLMTPLLAIRFGTTTAIALVTLQLTGWASRWQPHGLLVALFGLVSGFFGGVAGNQGGLRSAALTAFGLPPLGFVATATAIGLLVDTARTPVYLWNSGPVLVTLWAPIIVATVGVVIGTVLGERMLLGLSPRRFGQTIGAAIGALGIWMLVMPV